ncbi:phytanoyl-CoA dioxygenase family protein [Brevibacillus fulvus]|uniref:Ectoine hydroxylase-related dioxygenase (Phytanoyl-CoA dioxygenase family) n=1 Tax=Brevibacillus fulvus TaxID=1125967 RepID=A0A938XSL4_9BACL|nr:phytanoyl-CoA dioxygenase family protein [Brevibacillus fulvus]MBM7589643.1 ectoine hydroxylase-related dioxygenase (phytanoyl-CoA dioxygenase family) [Brevibacillus fulvus]
MNNARITAEDKERFEQEGYLKISGLYSQADAKQLIEQFQNIWSNLVADRKIVQDPQRPVESLFPRLRDYHKEHPAILRFVLEQKAIGTVEALLGEEPLVISTSYYFKGPGTRGLPLHQDNYSIGVVPGTTCSVWVSLDAADEENGGLYVIPGSHKMGLLAPKSIPESDTEYGEKLEIPEGAKSLFIQTAPGDAVIFNGNLLHGSTANLSSNRFRRAIVTHYTGVSAEKVVLNYNHLLNKQGEKVRRRFNTAVNWETASLRKTVWSGVSANNNCKPT